jgi:hypothetical protein
MYHIGQYNIISIRQRQLQNWAARRDDKVISTAYGTSASSFSLASTASGKGEPAYRLRKASACVFRSYVFFAALAFAGAPARQAGRWEG